MHLAFSAALLALIALVTAAEARQITGQMAYRERIALPADAVLRLELRGASGIVTQAAVPGEGRQVPLAFALVAPDDSAFALQGAIFVGGRIAWLSDVVAVPAGAAAFDIGLARLTPAAAMALMAPYRCGDRPVSVGFLNDTARLEVGDEAFVLPRAVAASGARYSDGAAEETSVWNKGAEFMLTLKGSEPGACVPLINAPLLPFTARGNEPGWQLKMTAQRFALESGLEGARVEGALPALQETAQGSRFAMVEGFSVTVARAVCRDSMTGMPHPLTVRIEPAGETLAGCGGQPVDILAGTWRVTRLGGADLAAEIEVTITFDPANGRMSGSSGCNQYNGGFTLTGEGLSFGATMATMMACAEPQMLVEQELFKALDQVRGFDVDQNGALLLLGPDGALITARR